MSYCTSRFHSLRRTTSEVMVGGIGIGGKNPVRIQSMTTSDTQDVDATVKQTIALAEVGCEIVRITAPNVQAARCLKDIRAKLDAAGFKNLPLVADIHFLPQAAMEAVEHVEKVRVNPGNYADKKKFAVRDYTDADYDAELQRIYETFTPLVKRAKELGRALRIGTNHGSLSDRIMNRYGDTPLGMVESALEFLRIAESHGYRQLVLSMKSSNPKVMIQAYRLLVQRMQQEQMHYPLHLGVTEAGDGEDGRIKGAIGIGSLLLDGLGDTIRVSLTEDSVYEVPVAAALANKAAALWNRTLGPSPVLEADAIDPYHFTKRPTATIAINSVIVIGPEQPPRVIARVPSLAALADLVGPLSEPRLQDTPPEGLLVATPTGADLAKFGDIIATLPWPKGTFAVAELGHALTVEEVIAALAHHRQPAVLLRRFAAGDEALLNAFMAKVRSLGHTLAIATDAASLASLGDTLRTHGDDRLILTLAPSTTTTQPPHASGAYRQLAEAQRKLGLRAPLWIRNTSDTEIKGDTSFLSRLLESSILTGSLLCDGLGDLVSIETEADPIRAIKLAYNVLQGASARITKTEFVACPSCGRTLFDLQTTTQRIRAKTGHLKGVKIAIMGCIVNGPGEMADADFGYVGGAPGKINLYVGKNCVQYNIPQANADDRLIALIAEHGKWVEPPFPSV